MSKRKKSEAKTRNTMATVLMLPVVMCAAIGVVVVFADPAHGAMLIGLAVVLGITNFLVIKVLFKKLSDKLEGE
jgi:hypothetical protein